MQQGLGTWETSQLLLNQICVLTSLMFFGFFKFFFLFKSYFFMLGIKIVCKMLACQSYTKCKSKTSEILVIVVQSFRQGTTFYVAITD